MVAASKIINKLQSFLQRSHTKRSTYSSSPQNAHLPEWDESSLSRHASARLMEILGLILLVMAVAIGIALFSFNPHDPSFNTATGTEPTNILGRVGATIADGLIQWFGIASTLPIIILLAWTWCLVRYHSLRNPIVRIIMALCVVPIGALFISAIQLLIPGMNISWPTENGLGGHIGQTLAQHFMHVTTSEVGSMGGVTTLILTALALLVLFPLALGLKGHEWHSVGQSLYTLVRAPLLILNPTRSSHNTHNASQHLYNPTHPRPPMRHGKPQITSSTLPSGFLRRSMLRSDPQTFTPSPSQEHSQTTAQQTWVHPPQDQSAWSQPSSPEAKTLPKAPPQQEEEHIPSNPYGEKLAQIDRTTDKPPPRPTPNIEDDYNIDDDTLTSSQIEENTPSKTDFITRFISRARTNKATHHTLTKAETSTPSLTSQDSTLTPEQRNSTGWLAPSLNLLNPPPSQHETGPSEESLQANARLLENVLNDYGVQGKIQDYRAGPVVTLYELEPAPGVRSSRVIGLADDLARSLAVLSVRIATVPGRNVIGIEVPNKTRETVYFPELLHAEDWINNKAKLPLALGKDIAGEPVFADLAKMPHLLVAGTTGSGKSVGINAMILSLLYRLSPEDCRLIMIDPKILELSIYDGIPHLMTPVVTEPPKAVSALKWAVQEMDRRYRLMADHQVRNISSYNDKIRRLRATGETPTRRIQTGFDPETGRPVFDEHRLPLEHLPYIVIVIDEMADLMMVAGKEIESSVLRLAQKARAAGVHVIMATQRPSVDVITGTIKANFPTRISFQVTNKYDSRTILGEQGAEQLLGRGDMLFMQGGARITRVHGPFISDEEVEAVVADLRSKGEPVYNADVTTEEPEEPPPSRNNSRGGDNDGTNELYEKAIELVIREQRASTSFVQRHLSIGYNRAANIIDQMEREGIISSANHVGKRNVLATRESLGLHDDTEDADN